MKNNTLRLNLIFALFRPKNAILFLIYALIFGGSLLTLRDKTGIAIFVISVIFAVYRIVLATKSLVLKRDTICFNYTHFVRRVKKSIPVRVDYTVTNISTLKFEQNAVEKLFNAGHISFTGRTFGNSSSLYYDDIDVKTSFTFYGLTDFKNTKKEICNVLGVNETE